MPFSIAIYVVLIAASVASAVYFNDRLGYTPLLFLLCLTFFDILYIRFAAHGFSYGTPAAEGKKTSGGGSALLTVEHGQRFLCHVPLHNRGRLPLPRVRVALRIRGDRLERPLTLVRAVALKPRSDADVVFDAGALHVGLFTVQVRSVKLYDPLGICRVRRRRGPWQELLCTPRMQLIDEAAETMPLAAGGSAQQSVRQGAGGGYDGVRDYKPGDPLHSIHWKLTAKNLDYMTRLYENDSADAQVVVDLSLPELPAPERLRLSDKLLETAVSAVASSLAAGGRVTLVYAGEHGVERTEICSPAEALDTAAVSLLRSRPGAAGVEELLPAGAVPVLVCTANADVELVCRLLDIKNGGGRPMLLYVVPDSFERKKENRLFDFLERLDMEYLIAVAERPVLLESSGVQRE